MSPIGVLCTRTRDDGSTEYAVINPEHFYVVLTPEDCPDSFLTTVAAIGSAGEYMPEGIIMDGGKAFPDE